MVVHHIPRWRYLLSPDPFLAVRAETAESVGLQRIDKMQDRLKQGNNSKRDPNFPNVRPAWARHVNSSTAHTLYIMFVMLTLVPRQHQEAPVRGICALYFLAELAFRVQAQLRVLRDGNWKLVAAQFRVQLSFVLVLIDVLYWSLLGLNLTFLDVTEVHLTYWHRWRLLIVIGLLFPPPELELVDRVPRNARPGELFSGYVHKWWTHGKRSTVTRKRMFANVPYVMCEDDSSVEDDSYSNFLHGSFSRWLYFWFVVADVIYFFSHGSNETKCFERPALNQTIPTELNQTFFVHMIPVTPLTVVKFPVVSCVYFVLELLLHLLTV